MRYNRLKIKKQVKENVAALERELAAMSAGLLDRLVNEFCERTGTKPSGTTMGEVRRTYLPADKRYVAKKKELDEARADSELLHGLMSACVSRGYRLQELVKLSGRLLADDIKVIDEYGKRFESYDAKLDRAGEEVDG